MLYLIPLLLAAATTPDCVVVDSDAITLADLARAVPAWRTTSDIRVGYAPMPGERRQFEPAQLESLAQRNGLAPYSGPALCVERASLRLSDETLLPVLMAALKETGWKLNLKDYLKEALPAGRLEFLRSGLTPERIGTEAGWLWRGRVIYGDHRSRPVWAKVTLSGPVRKVKFTRAVEKGARLTAADLSEERSDGPIEAAAAAASDLPLSLDGLVLKTAVSAGVELKPAMLEAEAEIHRGDEIEVASLQGGIRLKFKATAETGGPRGARILLRTTLSKKLIQGYVVAPGRATLEAPSARTETLAALRQEGSR